MNIFSNDLVCGEPQFSSAFYSTLYPTVFIFMVVALFLEIFPGWLRVFTNTFGIGAAYMFGIKNIIKDIFTESNRQYLIQNNKTSGNNAEQNDFQFMKTLDLIYNDPLPVINELDLTETDVPVRISVTDYDSDRVKAEEFDSIKGNESIVQDENNVQYKQKITKKWAAWELLKEKSIIPNQTINPNNNNNNIDDNKNLEILKEKLQLVLNVKRDVGYFLWYFLIGIITVQASTNTVLSETCSISKSNIDKSYLNFIESVKT
tara:strand:- start:1151 stop:1933 length:783 start_codon:yes stop_codon:yes gene_type:complete